ncbi:nucleotide exchange factor GrpE [Candidatus Uhrbacteria bacterium]|nr:nucleotide exchange factor GrpE [Candidatus Uhrbacteria bacterium]
MSMTPSGQEENNQASAAEDTTAQTNPATPSLQEEVERLKKLCEENLNGWKRAKADYINYKNEQEKHAQELAQVASMGSVMQMIPVYEQLRKAFLQLPDELKESAWVKGVEQISKQLKDALKNLGVAEQVGLQGKQFDPAQHQAIGQEYVEELQENCITQEINAGYTFHGKVLLPARVIVNKKPEEKKS